MEKLFLLDAYALIFRSYYALIRNPRINSKGLNTSAILGFVNTLNEIITKERPTYIQNKDQHIFVGFHKEKDNSNRRREFLLSWNTTDSKEMILETAKKIGITDEFDYDSLEQNKSKPNLLFYILIIAVVMILYKLFQK